MTTPKVDYSKRFRAVVAYNLQSLTATLGAAEYGDYAVTHVKVLTQAPSVDVDALEKYFVLLEHKEFVNAY